MLVALVTKAYFLMYKPRQCVRFSHCRLRMFKKGLYGENISTVTARTGNVAAHLGVSQKEEASM